MGLINNTYFTSNSIKVFPCANRANFQIESKLNTEYKNRVIPGINPFANSYIVAADSENSLSCVIAGYYFEINTSVKELIGSNNESAPNNIYLAIKLKEAILSGEEKTKVLANFVKEQQSLDNKIDDDQFCFTGLKVVSNLETDEIGLCIITKDANTYNKAVYLPKISKTGPDTVTIDEGNVVVKNISIENASTDTINNNETITTKKLIANETIVAKSAIKVGTSDEDAKISLDAEGNIKAQEVTADNFNGALVGNADTADEATAATKLKNARTISVGGQGIKNASVTFDGTQNVAIQTNIDFGDSTNPDTTNKVARAAHTHGNITPDGCIGNVANKVLVTEANGKINTATEGTAFNKDFGGNGTASTVAHSDHVHGNITNDGRIGTAASRVLVTGTNGTINTEAEGTAFNKNFAGTGSTASVARSDHYHGNITNDGRIGTLSGSVIVTGGGGFLEARNPNTAFNKSFAGTGTATSVARSDHHHVDSYGKVVLGLPTPTVQAGTIAIGKNVTGGNSPKGSIIIGSAQSDNYTGAKANWYSIAIGSGEEYGYKGAEADWGAIAIGGAFANGSDSRTPAAKAENWAIAIGSNTVATEDSVVIGRDSTMPLTVYNQGGGNNSMTLVRNTIIGKENKVDYRWMAASSTTYDHYTNYYGTTVLGHNNNIVLRWTSTTTTGGTGPDNSIFITNYFNQSNPQLYPISKPVVRLGSNSLDSDHSLSLGVGGTEYTYMTSGKAWTVVSDKRDKTNVEKIDKATEFINELKPVTFNYNRRDEYYNAETDTFDEVAYKNKTKMHDRRVAGFIAQDVYSALKKVYKDDNYADVVDYSFYNSTPENYSKTAKKVYDKYYLRTTEMIPFLVKAFNEQCARVDKLEKRIAELEKIVSNLSK